MKLLVIISSHQKSIHKNLKSVMHLLEIDYFTSICLKKSWFEKRLTWDFWNSQIFNQTQFTISNFKKAEHEIYRQKNFNANKFNALIINNVLKRSKIIVYNQISL